MLFFLILVSNYLFIFHLIHLIHLIHFKIYNLFNIPLWPI